MLGKLVLYFSAYSPLFLILALARADGALRYSLFALTALGVAGVAAMLKVYGLGRASQHEVSEARRGGPEAAGFLATYVVPVAAWSIDGFGAMAALVVFIGVTAAIYLRTSVIVINPVLSMLGWTTYEVRGVASRPLTGYVISRADIVPGEPFLGVRVSTDLVICTGRESRARRAHRS